MTAVKVGTASGCDERQDSGVLSASSVLSASKRVSFAAVHSRAVDTLKRAASAGVSAAAANAAVAEIWLAKAVVSSRLSQQEVSSWQRTVGRLDFVAQPSSV